VLLRQRVLEFLVRRRHGEIEGARGPQTTIYREAASWRTPLRSSIPTKLLSACSKPE
jgi:hypothetical protein